MNHWVQEQPWECGEEVLSGGCGSANMVPIMLCIVCSGMKCYIVLHAVTPSQRRKLRIHQRSVLETSFRAHFFPNRTTLKKLALETGLDVERISRWFRFKRYKTRHGIGDKSIYVCIPIYNVCFQVLNQLHVQ